MKKKILLIDVDDTLLDFTGGERVAITKTLSHFCLPTDEETIEAYRHFNDELWKAYEQRKVSKPELVVKRFEMLLERLNVVGKITPEEMNVEYFNNLQNQHDYKEGASEFIDKISEYYRIILITNGTTQIQNARLRDSKLINRVESVFISEQLGTRKPEKAYFEIVANSVENFDKSDCVLVGDSLTSDILGGKNYQIKTVWFNPNHKPASKDIIPDKTVYSFDELYTYLTLI